MSRLQIPVFSLIFLLLVLSTAQVAVPNDNDDDDKVQDIWRVDLHAIAWLDASEQHFPQLKYYHWENRRWNVSDAETFFGTQQPENPLIFFAQGYSLTTTQTTQVGLGLVRTFDPRKPCRVVFWDWYSDCGGGINIRRDVRSKIPVADNASGYLALFLELLEPQSKVCLFGFSFGSRIVSNAAEILRRHDKIPEGLRLHLVLAGAASDRDWFAKGQRHEKVPQIVEKILVTYSPSDWVLRLYPLIYDCQCRAPALGLGGLPMRSIAPEFRDRFENVNVNRYVGNEHKTLLHVQTPAFRSRVNTYFFFE